MPEASDASPSPPKRRRWIRWLIGTAIALILYRLVIWFVLHSIDEENLKTRIEDWAHALVYSDVSARSLNVKLNVLGQAEMNLHSLGIAHPNMLFEGNLLFADPVKVSCPVWGLWGFRVRPHGSLRNPRVRLLWNAKGGAGLAGFCAPPAGAVEPVAFPLGHINARTFYLDIAGGHLEWHRAEEPRGFEVGFEGTVAYDHPKRKLWGDLRLRNLHWPEAGQRPQVISAQVDVDEFVARVPEEGDGGMALTECRLTVQDLPVSIVRVLDPRLPDAFPGCTLSGDVRLRKSQLAIQGEIRNLQLLALGLEGTATCAVRYVLPDRSMAQAPPATEIGLEVHAARDEQALLDLSAYRTESGRWDRLRLRLQRLDLAAMPPVCRGLPEWLRQGSERLQQIEIEADQGQYLGLPAFLRSVAVGGRIQARVVRAADAQEEDEQAPVYTMSLQIRDLDLPTQGGGLLVQELAQLPEAGREVESLRHRALALEARAEAAPGVGLRALRFSSLQISCQIFGDGAWQFVVSGESPDLGQLHGGGRFARTPTGMLTGDAAFSFCRIPARLFAADTGISEDVRQAILEQVGAHGGLRLDLGLTAEGARVQRRYVQDIFMIWTQRQGRKAPEGR